MKTALFAYLSIFLFAGTNLPAQNPFIRHYSTADGLPSNTINWIAPDNDHFLWFSTEGGLVRYDGTTFTNYGMKDGLSHNEVVLVKTDKMGRVWLFCLNGRRDYFYRGKIYNEKNTPFLKELRGTFYFVQDKYGNLYFYSFHARRIIVLDKNNKVTKYQLPSIPQEESPISGDGMNIQHLTRLPSDEFLIYTYAGVYKTNDLAKEPKPIASYWRYHNIYPLGDTTMFEVIAEPATHSSLLVKYINGNPVDTTIFKEDALDNDGIIREGPDDILWISSYTKGLYCLKNKKVIYHFDPKEIQCIQTDHEGNIWIDAKNGAYKISPYILDFKHYDNTNFRNEGIDVLSPGPDGSLWSLGGQHIYLLKNDKFYHYDINQPDRVFKNIHGLVNNTVIFGEYFYDWYVMTGITTNPVSKKIAYNKLFRLPADGHLSVDKTRSEICLNEYYKKELTTFSSLNDFRETGRKPIGFAVNVFYDRNNDLAVLKVNGNFNIQNDKQVPIKLLNTLPRIRYKTHLNLDSSAELFLSTADSLYMINQNRMVNLTSSFDISLNTPIQRIQYFNRKLYLSTFRNIFLCENPQEIRDNKSVRLCLIDLNFTDIRDILAYNDTLYVASGDGLTILPTDGIDKIRTRPLPYFQSVMINDQESDLYGPELEFKGKSRINFSFGSINYSHNPVVFSYKLEGYDEEWTSGPTRSVAYGNLSPGKYVFMVRAGKSDTLWSEPIKYPFTIRATIWQHPLFYAALSVLAIGLLFLYIIRRKNLQLKRSEFDHQMATLEQKALQSMMNPHFIFNALGSIQNYLLQNKPSEAGLYLSQFARLIRQNLNAINSALINLEEETDRLKNYMDLEKLRMEDKFDYSIEFDKDVEEDEAMIPSMIIQPFVENAIWHGISTLKGRGMIRISFAMQTPKALKISIEDNGVGTKQAGAYSSRGENHLHMGMAMTTKRLEIIGKRMNIPTSVTISETSPESLNPGTRVVILVPVSYGKTTI
ncbi:MAG: histidine kinase [Bacteroidales bacterium]|nr:histidine kinase [Bacteroidales bacterium]